MNKNNKTEEILNSRRTSLSGEQKNILWNRIQNEVSNPPLIRSPFLFNFKTKAPMASTALVFLIMLGVGGTAAASNEARPGDLLFPVDQALEKARLALANNDSRAEIHLAIAEERLEELRSILAEKASGDNSSNHQATTSTTVINTFEAEADVFTDITIVKVEINDRKNTFETKAKTRVEVVSEIVTRFNLDQILVEQKLDFEVEDRTSRAQDIAKNIFHDDDDRIYVALDLIDESINFSEISDSEKSRISAELLAELYGKVDRIKIDDDEIEIRDGNKRIEIKEKDGETEVRIKTEDNDDKEEELDVDEYEDDRNERDDKFDFDDSKDEADKKTDSRDDLDRSEDDQDEQDGEDEDRKDNESDARIKIEVKVENGVAEVDAEYNGQDDNFTMDYVSKAALITELAQRFGLTETSVSNNLDLEIKD